MTFYHFTCLFYLPSIMKHGLNRGDIPLGLYKALNGPNLTRDPDPRRQSWNTGHVGRTKTRVRLTAIIDSSDPALRRWRDVCKKHKVPAREIKLLDPFGDSHNWYVYFGVIPSEVISVEVRNDFDSEYRRIDGDELVDTLRRVDAEVERAIHFVRTSNSPEVYVGLKPGVESSWLLE